MKIIKDKYLQKRGGSAKILNIYCQKCFNKLFTYQKDGVGQLKRCYINRITDNIKLIDNALYCPKCKERIGFGIIHTDKRQTIKLIRGTIIKKKYEYSNNRRR